MRARWIFVAIIGLVDCGSAPADVDAAAQDATTDDVDACSDPFACFDADLDAPTGRVVCPDAAYYFTINGDGDGATLSSATPDGVPVAFYFDCCGYAALAVAASANPDGGPSVDLERASVEQANGDFTFLPGPNYATYYRADGTGFGSYDDSLTTVITQLDPPGGFVAGSYAVTVASSNQPDAATLSLSGSFFACRVGNEYCTCPPPHQ
jgi:hypothetical protein